MKKKRKSASFIYFWRGHIKVVLGRAGLEKKDLQNGGAKERREFFNEIKAKKKSELKIRKRNGRPITFELVLHN